jgi:hypothetical protein
VIFAAYKGPTSQALQQEPTEGSLGFSGNESQGQSSQDKTDPGTAPSFETGQLPEFDELVEYLVCDVDVLVFPKSYEFSD